MGRHERDRQRWQQETAEIVGVDVDSPNIARMYDYFLGGSAHFAVDRAAAEEVLRVFPGNTEWAWINRSFLGRAVAHLCQAGIDQFLDLGSGVPTVGNVHEVAHRHNPAARVAYVDIESVAVHHARNLLDGTPHVSATQADIRQPDQVLATPGVAGLLDFTRPVAVLAVAILDILDSADAAGLMATYRDACPPGSALVLSHSAQLAATGDEVQGFRDVMQHTTTPQVTLRTHTDIRGFFAGYELVEPGLVPSAQWRPDEPVSTDHALASNGYAAVGLLP